MTKQEFIDRVAAKSGIGRREAANAVDAWLETVTDALRAGDTIVFPGFGKFTTSQRAERAGVNPQTREKITIAASRVPRFTAGSGLKKAVK